jgi:acetylornithine/succinyldiaminopimelate/putrescine aminotransferase
MCLAKGLGGGFPIGATVARAEVMDSFSQGEHGSTFGGNPLACAAAIATLNVIVDENLPGRAARLGEHLLGEFHDLAEKYNIIREERGLGLMLALEFRFPHKEIILDACEKGLLTLSSGLNIMRFLPPLIISREELDTTVSILDEVCAQNEK